MFDSISKTRICIGSSCQAPLNTILLSTFWNIHFHPILPQHLPLLHIPFSHYLYTTFVTNFIILFLQNPHFLETPTLFSHFLPSHLLLSNWLQSPHQPLISSPCLSLSPFHFIPNFVLSHSFVPINKSSFAFPFHWS